MDTTSKTFAVRPSKRYYLRFGAIFALLALSQVFNALNSDGLVWLIVVPFILLLGIFVWTLSVGPFVEISDEGVKFRKVRLIPWSAISGLRVSGAKPRWAGLGANYRLLILETDDVDTVNSAFKKPNSFSVRRCIKLYGSPAVIMETGMDRTLEEIAMAVQSHKSLELVYADGVSRTRPSLYAKRWMKIVAIFGVVCIAITTIANLVDLLIS